MDRLQTKATASGRQDEILPQYANHANAVYASSIVRSVGATIDQLDTQATGIYNANELATPWYADQSEKHEFVISGE